MGVLETAMKIANQDADAEDEEEDGPRDAAKVNKEINKGTAKWSYCYNAAKESDWLPFKHTIPLNQSYQCFIVCPANFCVYLNHYH